jgi:hypothetical protein
MSRLSYVWRYGLVLCISAGALLAGAGIAGAYELEPVLSLTGDCSVDSVDSVPDPGCPGGVHPPSGRFNKPVAVAIDPYGNEYVASATEGESGWIDVFDDEGRFITELTGISFPKSIAVDSKGNLYVFSGSDGKVRRYPPAAGSEPAKAKLEYKDPPVTVSEGIFVGSVTVDAKNDQLLVARSGSITRYKSAAEGNGFVASTVGSTWDEAIAIDAQRRRLFFSYCAAETTECAVKVLDADTFALLETIDGSTTPAGEFTAFFGHLPIAVDEETGEFCIGDIEKAKTVYCFGEGYEYLSKTTNGNFQSNSAIQIAISNGEPEPGVDAVNRHFLFVPVSVTAGRVLTFRPPDVHPPTIKSVSAGGIGETEAELRATIKPNGLETEYLFEYTTQAQFEAEGFNGATVAGKGSIAGSAFEEEVSVQIAGLQPGTAYRFRAKAVNDASPKNEGSPIPTEKQGTFTTYSDALVSAGCSNEALRTGPSAALPDCRAYELVTPPNTNGREPKGLVAQGDTFTTVETSPDGQGVSFRIEGGSLPGTSGTGSFNGDPYLSSRTPSGWTTELAGPSGGEATVTIPGAPSPDQRYSFWVGRGEGSAVVEGHETRYVRYPDGHSELIGRGSLGTDPTAKGRRITEGGTHIVFETRSIFPTVAQQLEPDAPPTGTRAVYDRTADEVTHVVSLLPGDVTPAAGQNAEYLGSSPDGEGIAFEIGGTLYLRKGNATTYEIGSGVELAGVSQGGERIFYLEGGDLLAYDTNEDETIEFSNTHDVTPVNVATGGTRAAFVSPSVLGGANPEGDTAQLGKQNLYLSAGEGQIAFVGTVTDRDVEGEETDGKNQVDGLGLWDEVAEGTAASDPSRLNPSGSVLLFQSRADLTGYDPGGAAEVYRYDSAAPRLHCLSCVPTGAPATGGGALQSYTFNFLGSSLFSPAVRVPNLTPDGNRVFFESTEALVSGDTDGVRDVYEWEEGGVGSCTRTGGCIYLISSGRSGRDNYLYGHSTDGNDVFFTTGDVLNGFDGGGTLSIYDARVNGGFAEPKPVICEGEGCHPGLTPPPALPAPESGARRDSGNVPKHCPKGKHKVKKNGKTRCVAKHKHHHKKAGKSGRAGK